MTQETERALLLDRLVAISGYEKLRKRFAAAPLERIRTMIAGHERANSKVARLGPLYAEWDEPAAFDLVE